MEPTQSQHKQTLLHDIRLLVLHAPLLPNLTGCASSVTCSSTSSRCMTLAHRRPPVRLSARCGFVPVSGALTGCCRWARERFVSWSSLYCQVHAQRQPRTHPAARTTSQRCTSFLVRMVWTQVERRLAAVRYGIIRPTQL